MATTHDDDPYTVNFRFKLQQDVEIVPLRLKGIILARCDRSDGFREYRVIYWANSVRNDTWLTEGELDER